MMNKKLIGERLRTLRRAKKETLEVTSKKLGITVSALAMYERGERVPRDETKIKIARYYGADIGNLFFT